MPRGTAVMTMHSIHAGRILRSDVARYFVVSLAAFALDLMVLSACLRLLGLTVALAATAGFAAGVLLAYVLSTRWVFRHRIYRAAPKLELAMFVLIGLAGLGITQIVLWFGASTLGLLPELVKVAAAGMTFVFNYAIRKSLLFVARPVASGAQGRPA